MPRDGLAFQLLAIETGEKVHQIVSPDRGDLQLTLLGEMLEFCQIPAICAERICRQALFNLDVGQERCDSRRDLHCLTTVYKWFHVRELQIRALMGSLTLHVCFPSASAAGRNAIDLFNF